VKAIRYVLLGASLAALFAGCKQEGSSSTNDVTTTTTTTTAATPAATSTAFPSIPAVAISGTIPATVPIPSNAPKNATPEQFRPYFDWFSWESFIALNWPASGTGRGNPNQPATPSVFTSMTNTTPVTWGTYKANWELYTQYDKRPSPWNSYDVAYGTGCPAPKGASKQLVQVAKIQELNDNMQAFSVPLVDQLKHYVYYEVDYNEAYYNYVRGSDDPATWLYFGKNLPTDYTVVCLPPNDKGADSGNATYPCRASKTNNASNSIMIKAAWRQLDGVPAAQRSRYYTVNAWVLDGVTKKCTQQTVGLVGLHIAQKTADFPEWIWSTFEQVDNVPPIVDGVPSTFNNGTNTPSTGNLGFANPGQYDPNNPGRPAPNPTPTQVVRVNPIPTTPAGSSTVDVNGTFHHALPKSSVWQYYQLIVTQWPSNPPLFKPGADRGVYPQGAGAAFPANGVVNTALETYFQTPANAQGAFGNSCMSCHYAASSGTRDFSWGFSRRPHSAQPPSSSSK
jgi:hypothetical protein